MRKSARATQRFDRRHEVDAELAGSLRAHVRVVRHELHAERVGALRDQHPDPAETDDAEHLVVELDAFPTGPVPLAGAEVAIGLRNIAGLCEQQRDGVLGRRQHVRLRRVHHHHAAPGRRFDVDVVEPDPGAADDHELVGRFEHLGGDLRGAADHQRGDAPDCVRADSLGDSPRRTSTSSPAPRIASRPLSASCSLTRTRLHRVEARRGAGFSPERFSR